MGVLERQEREQAIIRAAEEVFFSKGFYHAKMDEVAAKAGLSKGLLYFYFNSKEDLLMAITYKAFKLIISTYEQLLAGISERTGKEKVLAVMRSYTEFSKKYFYYHEAILNYMSAIRLSVRQQKEGEKGVLNTEVAQQSSYYQKIRAIHNLPVSIVINLIKEGVKDGSIRNTQKPQTIYVTLWAIIIGYVKLNISMGDQDTTIYHVNPDQWQEYLFQIADHILSNP
ncbi:TetR/AcrR family transcriptional regulator [Rhodoflexus sp.]